jgi:hypothetical protein
MENETPTTEAPAAPPKESPPINPMADKLNKLLSTFDDKGQKKPDAPPSPARPVESRAEVPAPAPEPKKSDAPAAEAPADDGIPDTIKSPRAAADFRKIKVMRDEALKRAEAAEARIKEMETSSTGQDVSRIAEENKRMSEELRLLAIERHPRFQAHFSNKEKLALDQARRAVGTELSGKIESIIRLPESDYKSEQLEAIMGELTGLQQGRLAAALTAYDNVTVERESEISKAKQDYESYAKSLGIGEDKLETQRKAAMDAVETALGKSAVMESFKGASPEEKMAVEERKEFVRDFVRGRLDESIYPWVPILAAEAMFLRETKLPALEKQLKEMKDQLAAAQGSSPSPGGSISGSSGSQAKSSGFIEAFKKHWPGE